MSLWVPPRVSRELEEGTRAFNVRCSMDVETDGPVQRYWNPRLRLIDDRLALVQAKERVGTPGLRAGFWHIRRNNEAGPVSLICVEGPDGGFMEPSSRMEDLLLAGDLQSARTVRGRDEAAVAAERARVRDDARDGEDRRGHMLEYYRAITRQHVSMTDARPWTNAAKDSARGKTGRKAA